MKAVCITNRNKETPSKNGRNAILTIGKVYDVKLNAITGKKPYPGYEPTYILRSDVGNLISVPKYYFKPIDEYRQELIDNVLE